MAPYWIEDTGTSWSYSSNPNYRTSIVLPLKKEALTNFLKLKENLYLAFDKNLLFVFERNRIRSTPGVHEIYSQIEYTILNNILFISTLQFTLYNH